MCLVIVGKILTPTLDNESETTKSQLRYPTMLELDMSRCIRKPTICICKNNKADQLHSNCKADQHLCFRYKGGTIPLLHKFEILSF